MNDEINDDTLGQYQSEMLESDALKKEMIQKLMKQKAEFNKAIKRI